MIHDPLPQRWIERGRHWPISALRLGAAVGTLALAYLAGCFLPIVDNPLLMVFSLAVYLVAVVILYRPELGVHFFVFLLLNFSSSVFFRAGAIVLGPLTIPGPLSGVAVLTIALIAGRRLFSRQPIILFESAWMTPLLLILLAQVTFAVVGYGSGAEIVRLTSTVRGLAAFPLTVLVLRQLDQVRRLLRSLALSYLLYAAVNVGISWTGHYGYRGLNPNEYTLSAATTVAALLNLFIPVCLGAFVAETDQRWRGLFLTALLSTILLSLLTLSRGGLLGIGFSLLAWMVLGRRYLSRRLVVGFGAALLMVLIVNSTYNVSNYPILTFSYHRALEQLASNDPGARHNLYWAAWQMILKDPLTGIGAGRLPSHSLFLSAGLDGGILFMGIWLIMFAVLVVRSFSLWRRLANDPVWGAVALGLCISMALAFVQNWLDMMLYEVGYGLVFWLLRGMESVLDATVPKARDIEDTQDPRTALMSSPVSISSRAGITAPPGCGNPGSRPDT